MARINLLPWREERRKEKQREFAVAAVGSAVVMLLVILYVHLHINGLIDTQESRNAFLEGQIKEVEGKIKEIENLERQKKQLIARMKVIEELQGNRPAVVHLFDELVKTTPEGLHLDTVQQKGNLLTIKGLAQSNARVSAFMRNLDASPWFDNPVLEVIESGTKTKGSEGQRMFILKVTQSSAQKG